MRRGRKRHARAALAWLLLTVAFGLLIGCSDEANPPAVLPPDSADSAAGITDDGVLGEANDAAAKPFVIKTAQTRMGASTGAFYEIFVRSFYDSDGDGIGDLQGVIDKLDYVADLGFKGIWLMPIQPSPSYHGYDVTDYYDINPDYGTLDDLRRLTEEAHKRGIKIVMDLVVNHTSREHPWFLDAAGGNGSKYRNWYVWAEDRNLDTGEAGPWGQQVWHKRGDSTYLGVFWEGMPDLNFDEPAVRRELIKIGQFWLNQGVDGFRLDAAKHIYGDFASSAADPKTSERNVEWWQQFRSGMEEVNADVYLIGEVWDAPHVVAPYLDRALDSGFNFDLASLLIGAARMERAPDLAGVLNRMYETYGTRSGGSFVDAPFLSNHDQNRVMSELAGNVDRAKMAASLLLTLPGNPFVYYGEEIGMHGAKPDERIREPMPWSASGDAEGEAKWEPSYHRQPGVSVEEQLADPDSLLNHYKTMLKWRNEEPLLGDGGIAAFPIANSGVAGFIRVQDDDMALVVHNMTGDAQVVDLQANGTVPFARIAERSKEGTSLADGKLELPPYSSVLLKP